MNEQPFAAESRTLKRRWSRLRLGVAVLLVVASVLAIDAYRRHRHEQWLVSEIKAVGGHVSLPEPLFQQLWEGRWDLRNLHVTVGMGGSKFMGEWTRLPPDVDGAWLRAHDDLAGLRITNLLVGGTKWTGAEIAALIERHPIHNFNAWELKGADDAARALSNCATVRGVDLEFSDLTDEGFRALPLEQLTSLHIAHAQQLTPDGLRELRRCKLLGNLQVDDQQAATAIAVLLEARRTIEALTLEGPEITDEHLERLPELQVAFLVLNGPTVSDEGVEELRKKLPGCQIEIATKKSMKVPISTKQ